VQEDHKGMKQLFYPRGWFFTSIQLLSAGVFVGAVCNPSGLFYWLLALFGYFLITCLGITVTFHRLLAHRSYKLAKPLEYIFSYFGNIGCTGSSVGWVFVHREHHKHADKTGDPHSPVTLGPIGAFIGDYSGKFNKWSVKEIINDPVHRFMHEYYILLILGTMTALLLIDPLLVVYLFFIPVFFNTLASRLSNWIDHEPKLGNKPLEYSRDQSHNVWWWSYLTFGEGWHNNHHARPGDYRIGSKWWQFDPGKYVIQILMFVKLAKEYNYHNKYI
jgi:stearoyl-CoA desaturase (delta-9 desaturase)